MEKCRKNGQIIPISYAKVDADSKLITDYAVTSAEVHDSNEFENFLNEEDQVVYADSAYVGKNIPQGVENRVNEKGYKGKPLTEAQKESNRQKSKTRARIEHVFGFITGSMHPTDCFKGTLGSSTT